MSLAKETKPPGQYVYKPFNQVSLAEALNVQPLRAVTIKWDEASIRPIMQIDSPKEALKYKGLFLPDVYKKMLRIITSNVVLNRVDNHPKNEEGVVDFDFSHFHSQFPYWAYEIFIEAIEEAFGKQPIKLIDCDRIAELEFPRFGFDLDEVNIFELSKANYFMRKGDGKCYLAVRLSETGQWKIGAALTQTHNALFRKNIDSKLLRIGFIERQNRLKPSTSNIL
ncbi:unnamed protein product [Albugo candida]|uniref:Peptidase A1 domain-containing protein n=1 Tax=Albugo candida TaxID=65357 RepID=A0A024FXK4_9STRA|nr:unnamed protein product [Albugo candida]|eukprot:CCI11389.1 unnamed protein product [Albugo candida]